MDTWTFDGTNWTNQGTGPTKRSGAMMAYDAATKKVVLFGGTYSSNNNQSSVALNDTWLWNGTSWSKQTTPNSPPVRAYGVMAYDPILQKVVLYGGKNGATFLSDTWTYDGTNWVEQFPAHSPGLSYGGMMAYDAQLGELVFYGGNSYQTTTTNTYTYDGTDWTLQLPPQNPGVTAFGAMTYDSTLQRIVLFGGENSSLAFSNIVWTYDGTNWTQATVTSGPTSRFAPNFVYDDDLGEEILVGGLYKNPSFTEIYENDTWALQLTPAGPVPTVTSISPASGPATGTGTITITGTGFVGSTSAKFGTTAATNVNVVSSTQVTATIPAGTGTVNVTVTTAGGTSATSAASQYTYLPAPTITGISPAYGPPTGGATVTITGTNLTGATGVLFGATAATNVAIVSSTQATATIPAGTGTVDVTITTGGGTSTTNPADHYTYQAPQVITFTPASPVTFGVAPIPLTASGGASGNPVTFSVVSGSGFISGSTLTVTGPGTIVVAADQAGNSSFLPATEVQASIVVNPATGPILSVVAGNGVSGYSGDGGQATAANLYEPNGGAFDTAGNMYIADSVNEVVRKVTPAGIISTFAGTGGYGDTGDGGPATSATLGWPNDIAVDSLGNLYIADLSFNVVRKVTPSGTISTVVGNGTGGYSGDGGPATAAQLQYPSHIAFDRADNLYISDTINNVVRKVTPAGIISTVAGTGQRGYSGDGGLATSATLYAPGGITVDNTGNLYIADTNNNAMRKVTPAGVISSVPSLAGLEIFGLATDNSGNIYLSDESDLEILKLDSAGGITRMAGNGTLSQLFNADGIFLDHSQNVYIADTDNQVVRKITLNNPHTLTVTAANITAAPGTVVGQLITGIVSPNDTVAQIEADLVNGEFGVTLSTPGFAQNFPIYSYGTNLAGTVIPALPANTTYTVTPYLTGPGAALFTLIDNNGTYTVGAAAPTQLLSVTAANITVYAGQTPTQTVAQLMASYSAPGLTGPQLAAEFSNCEIGFTVAVGGSSYNIPLYSYGTYYGANLLAAVPLGAPTGTFTLTPYLIGPGAANFSFTETPGTLTISNLQPLSVTAANITVHAGQPPTQTVAQLMASYSAPGLTGPQLAAEFANCEIGFTVAVGGSSYNFPLYSYGTYYGANLLAAVPLGAPTGTFTLTPYLIGPGAANFSFTETPGSLTIAYP